MIVICRPIVELQTKPIAVCPHVLIHTNINSRFHRASSGSEAQLCPQLGRPNHCNVIITSETPCGFVRLRVGSGVSAGDTVSWARQYWREPNERTFVVVRSIKRAAEATTEMMNEIMSELTNERMN
eukprot:GHVU01059070.1.p1 GENE.GHVU01059070.1~~GHVU01059070.1.p1  ORF type:complete len:126 (-),score=7.17 GHVU01059070.1:63-440(-)